MIIREAYDYEATREGAVYIVLIIVLGIAALNTNNNLLFIIVAAMLGAIGISGVCSWMMMRRWSLNRRPTARTWRATWMKNSLMDGCFRRG